MQRRYFLQLTQHLRTHHVSFTPNFSAPRLPQLPLRFNDSLVLRQLRYTGMLETVRIRQSGYSIKHTFQVTLSRHHSEHATLLAVTFHISQLSVAVQEFVRHFHVLLPRGTSPTKSGIREFFRRIHLPPAGYQVGHTMVRVLEVGFPSSLSPFRLIVTFYFLFLLCQVFLREAERQRLQTLLHQEVLRRIVMLQRRFRAVLERRHFVSMRRAARVIQVRRRERDVWVPLSSHGFHFLAILYLVLFLVKTFQTNKDCSREIFWMVIHCY